MGMLEGKVAIITGAAQGMGEKHAIRFVKEGAKVVVTDIQDELGKKLADKLGENAVYMHLDVTSEENWAKVVADTEAKFGYITTLVNRKHGPRRTDKRGTSCSGLSSTRSRSIISLTSGSS